MRNELTMTHTSNFAMQRGARGHWLRSRLGVAALALTLPLSACDSLLNVKDPDIVTPENLTDEIGLQTLRNGALGNFNLAYVGGGSTDGQVMIAGLMTDEWMHSGTFPTRQEVELRIIPNDNGTMAGVYLRLHRARVDLENAATKIQDNVSDPSADARIPELLAHAGYTYIAFAENYCSGVPFSQAPDVGDLVFGSPETTAQILDRAIAHFDAAIGHAAASTTIQNMARVGKGRALLNKGDFAAAATAVTSVPDNFRKFTEHSNNSDRERNGVYELNFTVRRWSVGDQEGINGLNFRSSGDPRIWSVQDSRGGFDGTSELWTLQNYQDRGDKVVIASGVEARLIEAEAALQAGQPGTWLGILNTLRANFSARIQDLYPDRGAALEARGSLGNLSDPGTAAGRANLHFRERAFWLFSTAHRLGDFRRLIRQYGRTAESVFPTGAYFKAGSTYGTDVNFPIPQDEENNPNAGACLDRNP